MWIPEETRFCSKYNQVGGKETLGLIYHLHPNNVDLNFCTAYFQLAIDTSVFFTLYGLKISTFRI